jgi:para-nitrobenzyl esterase
MACAAFLHLLGTLNAQSPIAKTEAGLVAGSFNIDHSVSIYKGVPFAAPPVGNLRWREPQPPRPWKGTLVCQKFAASPIQNTPRPFMMWSQEFIAPAEPLSEDCLYLNIWTPTKSDEAKKPVLVYIYGGGFVSGSSACAVYDGEALAKEGIVYVSINYRVGIFGFLSHPELTKESSNKASGNYALLDQIAALQWIKKNIAAFGGDPSRVTIAGQSAGSFSVQALVASPLAKGLFRGAIAHSGASFTRSTKSLIEAEKTGEAISQMVGKPGLKNLRALPADSVLKLANQFPFGTFGIITDGYVLPEKMADIFKNKKHNDVPLIAGWVTGDANLMGALNQSKEKFIEWAGVTYGDRKDSFLKVFPAQTEEEAKRSQEKLAMLQFAGLADHQWASFNASNSYLYQFSYVPTDKPRFPNYGAFHSADVPFALHTLKMWDRPWTNVDYSVEKFMSAYWINFIKNGNPNGEGLPDWKKYDFELGNIMELGKEPILKSGILKAEFSLLESAIK